jgi:hypothetical protein
MSALFPSENCCEFVSIGSTWCFCGVAGVVLSLACLFIRLAAKFRHGRAVMYIRIGACFWSFSSSIVRGCESVAGLFL